MKKKWLEVLAIARTTKTALAHARVSDAQRLHMIEAIARKALHAIENSPAVQREKNAQEAAAEGDDEVAMMIRMGR